jgi:hypothetical protein
VPQPRIKLLGVYRLPVTEQLIQDQVALLFPGKLDGRPRQRAEQRARQQLESTVLIEALVEDRDDRFNASDFVQPAKEKPRDNWQVAWNEVYLSEDGRTRLDTQWPDPPKQRTFRIAFFLHFWNPAMPLRSSYGEIVCSEAEEMPERLAGLVPYEPVD